MIPANPIIKQPPTINSGRAIKKCCTETKTYGLINPFFLLLYHNSGTCCVCRYNLWNQIAERESAGGEQNEWKHLTTFQESYKNIYLKGKCFLPPQ